MKPVLNGELITVYKVSTTAELHDFRNRYKDPDGIYDLLSEINAQVHWYSKESMQKVETLGYISSSGAAVIRTCDADNLGILPVEDEWTKFRIKVNSLGDKTFKIVEVRPICPLRRAGRYLFRKLFIKEAVHNMVLEDTERDAEDRPMEIDKVFYEYDEEVLD